MKATRVYRFKRVTPADLELLLNWQARPHLQPWWDGLEPADAEDLKDDRVARWIVSYNGNPFAYMQDYTVHGWEGHHFAHLPKGSRGIDQYISEADMLGKGHGSAFIGERVEQLFEDGAPVVAVDPHPDNAPAIAAYEKAGFDVFGPPADTPWGQILPMKKERP